MESEKSPNKAAQTALNKFNSWHSARPKLLHSTGTYAEVEIGMQRMDSAHRAGMVYELVESGWDIDRIDMEQKVVTARGSVEALPSYWTE